jgi:hypothetical protein
MTARDLAKKWLRSEPAIENVKKLFEFFDKMISGLTSPVDSDGELGLKKLADRVE